MAKVATPSPSVPLPAWAAPNSPPAAIRPKTFIPLAFRPQPDFHRAYILDAFPLQHLCIRLRYRKPPRTKVKAAAGEQPQSISKHPSALAATSSRNESRQVAEINSSQWLSSRLSMESLLPVKYTFQLFQPSGGNGNVLFTQVKAQIFPPQQGSLQ